MQKFLLYLLCLVFIILPINIYSFSQIVTPTNNSQTPHLNQSINVTVSGSENTSTFINWNNSLVGYWNFDSSNSTHVNDLSGFENNGEFYFNANKSNLDSVRGSYLNNSISSNNYVNIEHSNNLDLNKSGTLSLWFKITELDPIGQSTSKHIFTKREHSNTLTFPAYGLFIYQLGEFSPHYLRGIITNSSGNPQVISTTTQINYSWYMATLSWNSSNMYLYLNGNLESSMLKSPGIRYRESVGSFIGRGGGYSGGGLDKIFNGSIDEVMIFNRRLSQVEITALYNSQTNNFQFDTNNLYNNTQYNYELFTINATGDLIKESYTFYTNLTSSQNVNTQISKLISISFSSLLVILILVFSFLFL